jgi:hypothetical protein
MQRSAFVYADDVNLLGEKIQASKHKEILSDAAYFETKVKKSKLHSCKSAGKIKFEDSVPQSLPL